MPQLTTTEQNLIDKLVRKEKKKPIEAWRAVKKNRAKTKGKSKKAKGLSPNTVYEYCKGETHQRGALETRGRLPTLTKADVRKLLQTRRRLIKQAANQERVRYEDIEEAGLKKEVSQKTVEVALRAAGVRYRPARKKIFLSEGDAKKRLEVMKEWIKKPSTYWSKSVHAFMDNKAWPAPLTAKQRAKYNATKVTGHLRLAREGTDQGFTQPRTDHSFLGIPSVNICAAVAKDKIILWEDYGKKWNASVACDMYKRPLLAALRRTWGARRTYVIVEDGDRKGYQTNKAKQTKAELGIRSMVLPPRTPSMMPLDASIWKRVDEKMSETAPSITETKAQFAKRLKKCAKSLPRGCVARAIKRTRANIQAIIDAHGYHPKND